MKIRRAAALAALAAVASDAAVVRVRGFGPANCVSLSRSTEGTCVLRTSCVGQDLSNFDISFDCLAQTGRQTHSMGIGAFDVEEEYDTDMKCNECLPTPSKAPAASKPVAASKPAAPVAASKPAAPVAASKPAAPVAASKPAASKPLSKRQGAGVSLAAISVSREAAKVHAEPAPKAEWYGPEECVGVWRDPKSGTCVMQTDCDQDTQLNVYEFGLICVDEADEMTRHIFGMNSFAHKETFGTLIKCDKCLALDEYMDGDKAVKQLATMVKGMKGDLEHVSGDVVKLKDEVFPQAPGPAPAAAAPAPAEKPPPAKPAKFLVAPTASPPLPPAPEQAPQPQQVQPTAAKHQEVVQPQATSLGKDVTVVAEDGNAVQHLKMKASQTQTGPVAMSIGDILATAAKGAEDRGVSTSFVKAIMDKAGHPVPVQLAVQQQATPAPQHGPATPAPMIEVVDEDDSSNAYTDTGDNDHSDDSDDGDDGDDGFR